MIDEARHQRDESDQLTLGVGVIERSAVTAGFEVPARRSRRHRPACARRASASVLAVANHAMPSLLQARDERRWIQPHDRRDDARRRVEHRLALRVEIRQRDVAGLGRDSWPP